MLRQSSATEQWHCLVEQGIRPVAMRFFAEGKGRGHDAVVRYDLLAVRRILKRQLICCGQKKAKHQLSIILQAWSCVIRLLRISKQIGDEKKKEQKEKDEYVRIELQQAWRSRQLAVAWRLARILTGNRLGSKLCNYGWTFMARMSGQQWADKLRLPGSKGGWRASVTTWDQVISDTKELRVHVEPDVHDGRLAQADLHHISSWIGKAANRKMSLEWDLPNEVYRMILQCDETWIQGKHGIGYESDCKTPAQSTVERFKQVFMCGRATGISPLQWHRGHGCQVPKKGGDARIVHCVSPFSKAYHQHLCRKYRDQQPRVPQHAFGVRGRRREEVVCIKMFFMAHRMHQVGLSVLPRHYDVINALSISKS